MASKKSAAAKKVAPKKATSTEAKSAMPALSTGKLRITHPERVIDSGTGFTKLALIEHYARVAPLILPHLKARPVSLVRAPDGITGEQFFPETRRSHAYSRHQAA
jgi:bifunctional non-homologous end joining protein LigD